jgi:hypothetical protein
MMLVQGFVARSLGTMPLISSEPSTEEELPMLRIRLASLALASGLVFTLSGCCSFCEEGRPFPRLFNHSAMSHPTAECECQSSHLPQMMGDVQGPILTMPGATGQTVPIPITNIPPGQPPAVFKVPTASPTPYVPVPTN